MLKHIGKRNYFRNIARFSCQFQSSDSKHYDIIIAGGGLVGTTLACTLGKNFQLSSKRILLLEAAKKSEWKLSEKYNNRVSSISSSSFDLLNEIGAWKHIARYGNVSRIQMWDGTSNAAISFDKSESNEPISYIVENDLITNAVLTELKEIPSVDLQYESKIQNCMAPDEHQTESKICMENGQKYTCDLLLGCDGANSLVGKAAHFHSIASNYNHMGIVANLKLDEETENTVAWQRQLPNSTFLAILPLKKGLSSMVWSTDCREATKLIQLPEDQFVDAINKTLWKECQHSCLVDDAMKSFDNLLRFFNLESAGMKQCPPKILGCDINSRGMFPLGYKHSTNYVRKGVALIGDAAHRMHPLAGQGVNLGFGDVVCLNKILGEAAYAGSYIGSLQYLKEYEGERQRYNIPMMMAVHGLWQLYGTQATPLVLLRSLGLQATHAFTPLKRLIVNHASGKPLCQP